MADDSDAFLKGDPQSLVIPFSEESLTYDALPRIEVGISQSVASRAIALGE